MLCNIFSDFVVVERVELWRCNISLLESVSVSVCGAWICLTFCGACFLLFQTHLHSLGMMELVSVWWVGMFEGYIHQREPLLTLTPVVTRGSFRRKSGYVTVLSTVIYSVSRRNSHRNSEVLFNLKKKLF